MDSSPHNNWGAVLATIAPRITNWSFSVGLFLFSYTFMARVTIEDCLHHIPNRFEMILVASLRARQLSQGSARLVPDSKDKHTVVALREIASGNIRPAEILRRLG